jgi:histone deacetylase 1/2
MTGPPGIQNSHPLPPGSAHVIVGNGASLPVTHTGALSVPTIAAPLHLHNVLVCPSLVKNLVSVRALTRDNPVTVEFDAFGFSVKDLRTKTVLLRCDSSGELYPLRTSAAAQHQSLVVTTNSRLWHAHLGHLSDSSLNTLLRSFPFNCSRLDDHSCHACRLGKHVRLPFSSSNKVAGRSFELLHCDLWTSPVISNSGYKYYLVILDDHTHFVWTFPLRNKSEVLPTLICFHAYVRTQFSSSIASLQTDNGKEFDNHALRSFLSSNGMILRLTCPYTSQQNGRAERVLRTLNDSMRALLFHADVPTSFWTEALSTATYTLNRRPCRPRNDDTPYKLLYGHNPTYDHLRVFGCLCYPNLTATTANKLSQRSVACIFLGYPAHIKGYRCFDPHTNRVIVSRHVYFDEDVFPFRSRAPPGTTLSTPPPDETAPSPTSTTCRATARPCSSHHACVAGGSSPYSTNLDTFDARCFNLSHEHSDGTRVNAAPRYGVGLDTCLRRHARPRRHARAELLATTT